jgi:hypothetical protein
MREDDPGGIEQFEDILGTDLAPSRVGRTPAAERRRVAHQRRQLYNGLSDVDMEKLADDRDSYANARRIGKTRGKSRLFG